MQYGSSLVTPSVVLLLYIIGDFLYCALHVNLVPFVTTGFSVTLYPGVNRAELGPSVGFGPV